MRHAIAAAALLIAGQAAAMPGDLHRIDADLVNLRAGPSDQATIRDRLEGGTEVIELRSDGGWYGVRVVETGQEGWIYGRLLSRVASSELGGAADEAGFRSLSVDFDNLMGQINETLGVVTVTGIETAGERLTVTPNPRWLLSSGRSAQLLASASIYQMWKNHQNNAPVTVVMLDASGADYIVIEDVDESGPSIRLIDIASGSDSQG